ncbi:MAG: class I adenylate-forming enzyme family protein [Actinomycetota bacterium]|nr:class I adenylate-forming enzyme family protein [Actinomycetota bacterium]
MADNSVPDDRQVRFPDHEITASGLIRHVGERWGDRVLVILGADQVTYREIEHRSAELAKALLGQGVTAGTRMGLLAPNGPDWVVAWLAMTRIGAVSTLLSTYARPPEMSWALDHAGVEVLFSTSHYLDRNYPEELETAVPELATQRHREIQLKSHPDLSLIYLWGDADRKWAGTVEELVGDVDETSDADLIHAEEAVTPASPMVVMYTSGSTAEPKGVMHSHGAVVQHPYNLLPFRDLVPGDVLYTPMPLFWVGGLAYTLISAMHAGATVVFEERFEPGATLDLIEREHVTHVIGWPHMSRALTEHPSFQDRDLSAVRGGSLDALLPASRRVGDPELRANSLGMTESLGPHSIELIGSALPENKRGSFGRAVPGIEHRIVDPSTGQDVTPGELGEIWIRGYSLMLGVLGKTDHEVFTSDGWYRTGDVGYIDADGHLYFKGRMGNQIKTSGMNVTPREVELAIEEQPEVMHAFVTAVDHKERGQDVAAAVVFRPGKSVNVEEIKNRLRESLSSYKVPRHIATFTSPDDLVWLESGKIDLRALTEMLSERYAS